MRPVKLQNEKIIPTKSFKEVRNFKLVYIFEGHV